jgi:hypothetical protein
MVSTCTGKLLMAIEWNPIPFVNLSPPKSPANIAASEQEYTVKPPRLNRYAAPISPTQIPTAGPPRWPASIAP